MSQGYLAVTEVPGASATAQQLAMLQTRYRLMTEMAKGRDVLELACGPGMGLGLVAELANRLVGGDYDHCLLGMARAHYGDRIPLLRLDAHVLPFASASFDVVVLFEAIYYLQSVDRFLEEARRVLRVGGTLLLCTANKERPGFRPSPFSAAYYSAAELRGLLSRHGFEADVYAAFPVGPALRRSGRSAARWLADAVGLGPNAKRALKRILFGERLSFPAEATEAMAEAVPLVPLTDGSTVADFQVLYSIGRLR
jgi:ubiquinone/menaquinone biosynthesis C-methylase UbiE